MSKKSVVGARHCEVCGIVKRTRNGIFLSRFPIDIERCRGWLRAVGKEDLVYLPLRNLINKFVCGDHFHQKYFTGSKRRLKRTAIPTLNLTRPPIPNEILVEFPLGQKKIVSAGNTLLFQDTNDLLTAFKRSKQIIHTYCTSKTVVKLADLDVKLKNGTHDKLNKLKSDTEIHGIDHNYCKVKAVKFGKF